MTEEERLNEVKRRIGEIKKTARAGMSNPNIAAMQACKCFAELADFAEWFIAEAEADDGKGS